jgi:hypothetical protein
VRPWLLLGLAAACGDPLVDGNFVGDPLFSAQALVVGAQSDSVDPAHPMMAIGWKSYDADGWNLDEITRVEARGFPAIVELSIFDPPQHDPLILPTMGRLVEAHVGCPVMFDDVDGDGVITEDDQLIAVSWNQLLVFVRGEAGAFTMDGPFRLTGNDVDDSYRVFEGICDEHGDPTGELRPAREGQPIEVTFLDEPNEFPDVHPASDCTRFF